MIYTIALTYHSCVIKLYVYTTVLHFINFFNPDFFGIVDDDGAKTKKDKTVSLTVPIDDAVSGRNKTNLMEHKIPEITDFTDVERVIK